MENDKQQHTHIVYGYTNVSRRMRPYPVEIGTGYFDERGIPHAHVDRMPLGFNGHWTLVPKGSSPVLVPEPQPQRPGESEEE